MFILPANPGDVLSLAFAPDNGTLYAAHRSSGIHVWNLADRTSQPLQLGGKYLAGHSALLPGGRWAFGVLSGAPAQPQQDTQRLLDLRDGSDYPFNYQSVRSVALTPDGTRIVARGISDADPERPRLPGTDSNRLYGWAVTPTGPRYEWHRDFPQGCCAWALGALGNDRFAIDEEDRRQTPTIRTVVIRATADGLVEHMISYADWRIDQLLGSPDGTKLVARQGTELRVWDASDWKRPPVSVAGKDKGSMGAPAAAFHPTAPYQLLATGGPSVVVFDTATWNTVRKWNWRTGGTLRTVAVSSDGTLAAAGGPKGTVVVWDLDL